MLKGLVIVGGFLGFFVVACLFAVYLADKVRQKDIADGCMTYDEFIVLVSKRGITCHYTPMNSNNLVPPQLANTFRTMANDPKTSNTTVWRLAEMVFTKYFY